MPFRRRTDQSPRVGDWVVAVEPVGDIPEGTRGRIKVVDGFGWVRYWVAWDTGEWTGSVDSASVVRTDRLEQWRAEQEAAQAAAAARASGGGTGAGPGAGSAEGDQDGGAEGGAPGDGRVPEHLLERSRQARARRAAQTAG